ncbi:WecB/TagA/CpsF family glycosyltransferase [Neobacillus thermocopriae]|uniref:WecB/TagA/CpsF family glycosyltransferase n=1 Tax=Neobacillus thermocopriae TaxID=1215031 RepID=UPI002E1FD8B5|nr:WecB/TagA/CpsF family glycosyltransferase [Neobacillus thermocopriae]MED3712626.1 WecB/TagA/CpsF family glycosyltransferase [Neobacillus thermocopriae]
MNRKKINILNILFDYVTKGRLLQILTKRIEENKKTFLVTANPEIVMHANTDPEYLKIVNGADYVIADGIGVIIGSKIIENPLPERIPGFDLMQDLLKIGNEKGWSAYFLGAKKEVIEKAILNIKDNYPNLEIAGYHDGYFDWNENKIPEEIKQSKPDMVFVALGFPRQEKFIAENIPQFEKGLFIGVGGSFDVIAGAVKRAPVIWQKLNLEWLYRLIKQPSRWRRMLALPAFIIRMFKMKFSNRKDYKKGTPS